MGSKWFPIRKDGKPYKTGYSTREKAEAALSKSTEYWASRAAGGTTGGDESDAELGGTFTSGGF